MWVFFFFFFSSRRRHTRSLCDWSSDVCSSDLRHGGRVPGEDPLTVDGIDGPSDLPREQNEIAGPEIEVGDGPPAPLADDENDPGRRAGDARPLYRGEPLLEIEPGADGDHHRRHR